MTPDEIRHRIVRGAVEDEGKTDPLPYWQTSGLQPPFPPHWCGMFCLNRIQQEVPQARRWTWEIKGVNGAHSGFLWRLPITLQPKPADVLYRAKHQHHALVVEYDAERKLVRSCDGNAGATVPTRVIVSDWTSLSKWTSCYSIEGLVSDGP